MDVSKNYNEKELTVSVEGRIDTMTSKDLETELNEEMGNFDSLILDFDNVDYISSAGLRLLLVTQKKLKADEIPFVIINTADNVKETFKMSGFDKILKVQ